MSFLFGACGHLDALPCSLFAYLSNQTYIPSFEKVIGFRQVEFETTGSRNLFKHLILLCFRVSLVHVETGIMFANTFGDTWSEGVTIIHISECNHRSLV
jgi:hypothetical protein